MLNETGKRNNLDLMRLMLASLVMLSHSFELVSGNSRHEPLTRIFGTLSFGSLSVDCFFVVSGFLIIQSLDRSDSLINYFNKRIFRIFPGFVVCSLICIIVIGPFGSDDFSSYYQNISIRNIIIDLVTLSIPVGGESFVGSHYPDINGAVWTISYEFYCYIALGLIGITGLNRKPAIACLFILMTALYLLLRNHDLAGEMTSVPNTRIGTAVRFGMLFLAGATAAKFEIHRFRMGSVALICFILWCSGTFSPLFAEPALAVFGTYVLLYVAYTPLKHRVAKAIPDISYGTYLYGWPMQKLVILYIATLGPISVFGLSLAAALTCGIISWYAIEKPALQISRIMQKWYLTVRGASKSRNSPFIQIRSTI